MGTERCQALWARTEGADTAAVSPTAASHGNESESSGHSRVFVLSLAGEGGRK